MNEIDRKLVDYIKTGLQKGWAADLLRQTLTQQGWAGSKIEEALTLARVELSAPTPPSLPPSPGVFRVDEPSIYSPYSKLLVLVLVVSLFILTNKIITDLTREVGDISARLIFHALVVVPFLAASFWLNFSFRGERRHFQILSYPYFLVSGWLLIRLLFEVSRYILDQNTAYGVYIVLILVIAVLTAIIFSVQKYLHHPA